MDHERELLEQQLWELLYDLLPDDESRVLRERIGSEPEVAACYEQVIRKQKIVAEAVQWPGQEVAYSLPASNGTAHKLLAPETPRHGRRQDGGRGGRFNALVHVLAGLAAAVLVAATGCWWLHPASLLSGRQLAEAEQRLHEEFPRVVITAPHRLMEGAPQSFMVAASTPDGAPLAAEVGYAFFEHESGVPVAEGRASTGADGRVALEAPREWQSSAGRLEVRAGELAQPLVAHFSVAAPRYVTRLTLEKFAYARYARVEQVRFRGQAVSPSEDESEQPEELALHLVENEVLEGSTLKLEIASGESNRPLAVGVVCGEALVAQRDLVIPSVIPSDARSTQSIELSLPEGATGILRVGLYDYSQSPPLLVDEKLAYCEPRRKLRIEATPRPDGRSAGMQQWEVLVTDETGAPVQAILSVAGQAEPRHELAGGFGLVDRTRRMVPDAGLGAGGVAAEQLGAAPPRGGNHEHYAPPADATAPKRAEQLSLDRLAATSSIENHDGVWKYELVADSAAAPDSVQLGRRETEAAEAPVVIDNAAEVQSLLARRLENLRQHRNRQATTLSRVAAAGGMVLLWLLVCGAYLGARTPVGLWTATLTVGILAMGIGLAAPGAPTAPAPGRVAAAFPTPAASPGDSNNPRADATQEVPAILLAAPPTPPNPSLSDLPAGSAQLGDLESDHLDVWMPRLKTDANGRAIIALPAASRPTRLRLTLEGQGNGRSGAAQIETVLSPRQ